MILMKKILFILFALLPMMASAQYGSIKHYSKINDFYFLANEIKGIGDSIGFMNPDKKIISYEATVAEKIGEKGLHDLQLRRQQDWNHLSKVISDIDTYVSKKKDRFTSFYGTMDETIQEAVKTWLTNEGNNVPSDKKLAKRHIRKKERLTYWLNNIKTYDYGYSGYISDCLVWYKPFIEDSVKKVYDETIKGLNDKVQITKENKFYRGRNYQDYRLLNALDLPQQTKGWEWLGSNDYKKIEKTFPERITYFVFTAAPQYRIYSPLLYLEAGKILDRIVFDDKGNLIYFPCLIRTGFSSETFTDVKKDIKRLVYLKDFKNNKYNIKGKSEKTLAMIISTLAINHGFQEREGKGRRNLNKFSLITQLAKMGDFYDAYKVLEKFPPEKIYYDRDGESYIEQLTIDHSSEFGYAYIIERLSNLSFRVVYIHKNTLKPTHCAVVTFKTGTDPYTWDYDVKLVNLPSQIPIPIIMPEVGLGINPKFMGPKSEEEEDD